VPEKGTYVLEELDGARLGGTVAGNRLKNFHARETNPIGDFTSRASKVPDAVSAENSWHPMEKEGGESAESDNQTEMAEETSESTDGLSEGEEDKNESTGSRRMEKFVGVFIPARV
jgi:hypothetical protein